MPFRNLKIFHQVDPPSSSPFTIIETYRTIEGWRSRVVSGRWKSLEAVVAAREELVKPKMDGEKAVTTERAYDPDEE